MAGGTSAGKRTVAAVMIVTGIAYLWISSGMFAWVDSTRRRDGVASLANAGALYVFIFSARCGIAKKHLP